MTDATTTAAGATRSFEPIPLDFDKMGGLVPCVVQHAYTREVLMVGFMDREAWRLSCEEGLLTLYRRTLGRVWRMGEEDGKVVRISRVLVDCDDDTVVFETVPEHRRSRRARPTSMATAASASMIFCSFWATGAEK